MAEEAQDYEAMRAELDRRMQEVIDGSAGEAAGAAEGKAAAGASRAGPTTQPSVRLVGTERPHAEAPGQAPEFPTLEEVERRHITAVLQATGWRVSGPKGAARILDLNPSTLRSRMKKLGISRDMSRKRDI